MKQKITPKTMNPKYSSNLAKEILVEYHSYMLKVIRRFGMDEEDTLESFQDSCIQVLKSFDTLVGSVAGVPILTD